MSSLPLTTGADSGRDKAFLGHPIGLAFLAFTEAWERFSYYGMQTLLVLYMTKQLLLPGHIEHIAGFAGFRAFLEHTYGHALTTVALASAIFGLYTGLVYLTPLGGGLLEAIPSSGHEPTGEREHAAVAMAAEGETSA